MTFEILAASELELQRNVWWLREQAADLTERAVRAEAARDAFELVATTWTRLSDDDYQERERLRDEVARLRDETRALRASVMTASMAADPAAVAA